MSPGVPLPGLRAAGAVHGTLYMGCPSCLAEAWQREADMAPQDVAMGTSVMEAAHAEADSRSVAGAAGAGMAPQDVTMETSVVGTEHAVTVSLSDAIAAPVVQNLCGVAAPAVQTLAPLTAAAGQPAGAIARRQWLPRWLGKSKSWE